MTEKKFLSDGSKIVEPSEIVGPGERFHKEKKVDEEFERPPLWSDSESQATVLSEYLKSNAIRVVSPAPFLYSLSNEQRRKHYNDKPYRSAAKCSHHQRRYAGGVWHCMICGEELPNR